LNKALEKLRTIKCNWLIVDTTSYLIDYLRFYWCEKNGVEHESMIAYRGYAMLRNFLWESLVHIANDYADNVIFISHEQEIIEKNKFGREISKFQPVFEEKLRDQMSGLMSIIARTVKSVGEDGVAKYELHISNSDDEFGGSRLPVKATSIPLTKKDFVENFTTITNLSTLPPHEEDKPKRKSVIG
jgi:hypothetical protein